MRIALVHDWLNQMGGAESVLENLVALYPEAPVYTSIYRPEAMPEAYRRWDIRPSWLNRVPGIKRHHQAFLPLYPLAFEGLDLSGYDVVLTNKSGFCHGVVTGPETVHICYCLTPTRYLWRYQEYAQSEGLRPVTHALLAPVLLHLRMWDYLAAQRVDRFIAISAEVQRRIAKHYGRESEIVWPPVDVSRFAVAPSDGGYYLSVGRLVPYKRVDLAVRACTQLGLPLKVGGTGRDMARLKAMAGPTVEFLGWVPDDELGELMAGCRAFLFPGAEDFGIAPVQAMACGRPVIAYAAGGALDTVVEGVTGSLFSEQSVEALSAALAGFDPARFEAQAIRRHAEQYDAAVFRAKIGSVVAQAYEEHREWN